MAQSNKTDEFFSSRLEGLEMMPSDAAWIQVQSGLNKGKTKWVAPVLGIAAAVAVLIVGSMIIFRSEDTSKNYLSGMNDHPVYEKKEVQNISIPEIKTPEQIVKPAASNQQQFVAQQQSQLSESAQEEIKVIEMFTPETRVIAMDIEMPELPRIESDKSTETKVDSVPIKITYIAKSESSESEQILGKINRVVEVAKHASPAELLADLRDAKSNLLRRN